MRYVLSFLLLSVCSWSFAAADDLKALVKSDDKNWIITIDGEEFRVPKTVDMEMAVGAAKQSYRGVKPVRVEKSEPKIVPIPPGHRVTELPPIQVQPVTHEVAIRPVQSVSPFVPTAASSIVLNPFSSVPAVVCRTGT